MSNKETTPETTNATPTPAAVDVEALKAQVRAEIKAEEARENANTERSAEMAHRKAIAEYGICPLHRRSFHILPEQGKLFPENAGCKLKGI